MVVLRHLHKRDTVNDIRMLARDSHGGVATGAPKKTPEGSSALY